MQGESFVQDLRSEKMQRYSDSLERMAELVDFGIVAATVDAACTRPDCTKCARPLYPTAVMVRVLFLQILYDLTDEDAERQLLDRRSFRCFCGLADELRLPDARTIGLFRQRLTHVGLGAQEIFAAAQQQLRARGYVTRGGQIVDAILVRTEPASEQRR